MIKKVKLERLVLDYDFYPRTQVSDEHVANMREAILAGKEFPPIVVDAKSFRVVDGFHRYFAFKRLKLTEVSADVRNYRDEASMLEDAVRLNSDHGRPFHTQDRRRIILRAEELGLSRDWVAEVLGITRERVDRLAVQRAYFAGEAVPLKRGLTSMAGQELTEKQRRANERWGGMNAAFYAKQLIIYLDSEFPVSGELAELLDLLAGIWSERRETLAVVSN